MAKRKKKRLPPDFADYLAKGDLDAIKTVFEDHDINARGGYGKHTALAFEPLTDDLARWLVEQGADLEALNDYRETPLHAQAQHANGNLGCLVALGADIHANPGTRGTPLHAAANAHRPANVDTLLALGANPNILNSQNQTPLESALECCSNTDIRNMSVIARSLLDAGTEPTGLMAQRVTEIGEQFEFYRDRFNPDWVDAFSAALIQLYDLFNVTPVPQRQQHDGVSPITLVGADWKTQYQQLWNYLIPASGPALTVQGELIRIAGRIGHELDNNGGINWDEDFIAMAGAYQQLIHTGNGLSSEHLREVETLVTKIKGRRGDLNRLAELAVLWVRDNPEPMPLEAQAYTR